MDSSVDTPGFVKQVMNTMEQHPNLMTLSPFVLDCMVCACGRKEAASPLLSDVSQPSSHIPPSQNRGTTIGSLHAVSDYERNSYYNGIADGGEHPVLLYRTGSDRYPWIRPTGRHADQPTKALRGVHDTPLNGVWSTVGPEIRDLVRAAVKTGYSIDPARFVTTYGEDRKDILGPVVILIGVDPGSTSADTAHEVSGHILELLAKNGVQDVEVEWHEAVSWKAIGPSLLRVVGDGNPTVHVRRHLTAALGMPIATEEREWENTQGSVGFFFHENRDKDGNPSTKVFGVSNRHVLLKKNEGTYQIKGVGAPRWYVRLNGLCLFQRGLAEIKEAVSKRAIYADLYVRKMIKLETKGTSEDMEEAEEDAKRLVDLRRILDEEKQAMADLEKFYMEVLGQWGDLDMRSIGHIHYSPPISVDVEKGGYTEDWGTFELSEAKFKAQFKGNVVDLGTAIAFDKLTKMMHSESGDGTTFEYPVDRQFRINGIATQELLANPDMTDGEGQSCLIVLKDGCATDLTVGRYAGLESFLCDKNGVESIELAIYNHGKRSGSFSAKGDSGSLIFDSLGRMVGLLHSGKSRNDLTGAFVTYATPIWWLTDRIKEKYPHADFFRTSW